MSQVLVSLSNNNINKIIYNFELSTVNVII
jgi:hypothetical protein